MCKALSFLLVLILTQNQTANGQSAERELDRRLSLVTDIAGKLETQLRSENPQWFCSEGTRTKYGRVSVEIGCFLEKQAFHIDITHYFSVKEAAADLKVNLRNPNYPKWRKINDLGKQAIVTDGCERTWLRFRKGQFFIYINGNVNEEAIFTKPSKSSAKLCEQGRDAISQQLSETAGRIAKVIAEAIGAS
jgi:hypothetical protein